MNHIIGGMFGLKIVPDTNSASLPVLSKSHLLLATARSGIRLLVDHLRPNCVWMPSYLCDVMLKAVSTKIVQFYPVNIHLQLFSSEWLEAVSAGDLVIFIDYFGYPADQDFVCEAKRKQAWVLEDASQALLSTIPKPSADFFLYSPRKYLGVPDGGILVVNRPELMTNLQSLSSSPPDWWVRAIQASVLRYEYDWFGGDRKWFDVYQRADRDGPLMPYQMSALSKLLLQHHFDYASIAERRRENYITLLELLDEFALFADLPSGVIPLGFPVRMKNRERVRQHLFDHEIYPPVHWNIKHCVPNRFHDSHELSGEILTLVCDQRYDRDDMARTALLFRQIAEAVAQ